MTAVPVTRPPRSRAYPAWLVLVGLLTLGGLVGWIIQLAQGMAVTDMRNVTVWGLYIVGFMFFVGLSAGGLIISSAGKVFGIERFEPFAKIATFLSFTAIVVAAVSIVPDIGRPERLWHLIRYPNFSSPLLWDVIAIGMYLVLSAVYLWMMVQADAGKRSKKALKRMAIAALVAAVAVHSVTAWIFGLQISRPFWNSALLAPFFIVSALVSGTALLLGVLILLRRFRYLSFGDDLVAFIGRLLAVFILVELFFLTSEILTEAYPGAPEGLDAVRLLLGGVGAPMFWIEVFFGGIVAVALLLHPRTRANGAWVGIASILTLVGVFFYRFNLLMTGFTLPLVDLPAVQTGPGSPNSGTFLQNLEEGLGYFPSAVEWGIFAGLIALGALVFTLGVRYLPLTPASEKAHR